MIVYSTNPGTMITPGEVVELRAIVIQLREENQDLTNEIIRLQNALATTAMQLLVAKLRADNCTCQR